MDADPYETLGVSRGVTDSELKRAYRKLARKYHPDINAGAEAEARFKEVNDAYDVLRNPEKRAAFDQYGNVDPSTDAWRNAHHWRSGFEFSRQGAAHGSPFDDVFGSFAPGGASGLSGMGDAFAADQHIRLQISLEEAFRGVTREIHLRQPRIGVDGEVVLEDRRVAIPVPAGVLPGQFLRLPGMGLVSQEGTPAGDLIAEIAFAVHPTYRLDGRHLHTELPLTPWEAALGTKLTLPTPNGDVRLSVPKNAMSGQKLRLKGRGLPAKPPGHIYVSLRIVNPDASTAEARAFFEKMGQTFDFDPRSDLKG